MASSCFPLPPNLARLWGVNTSIPSEWIAHDKSLKPYLRSQRIVSILGTVVQLAVLVGILVMIWTSLPAHGNFQQAKGKLIEWLIFFGALGATFKLVGLPFSFAHYHLERKRGLSKQNLGSWLGDQLKGVLVGVVLGFIVLLAFFYITNSGSSLWWVWIWLFLMTFSILLAQLAPVILLPLFIKMKPMEAGILKDRLMALSARFNVSVKEVYHLGLGEKTEKGNAAFMGLGKTKRIVIGDTLYEKFPVEEVEAVFAHELGHQVHNDLWKGLALSAVMMVVTLGIAQYFLRFLMDGWGPGDPIVFFHFLVIWTFVQMPFNIGQAYYSRTREWAADRFASETTKMSVPLASALERLTYQNQGLFKPNAIWEWLTYSHPAPWRRILKLRS